MPYGTINADVIGNSNGMTGNAIGPGFKNRIINGAMVIDQRNAGASVTVNSAGGVYTLDRWLGRTPNSAGVFTVQRSTTAPTGFRNSLLCTVTTTATPSGSDNYFIQQRIEGFNVADLMLGTANARAFTVSFWVRSSVTGTFGGSVGNNIDQSYPFSFSINAANTFELKTITIPGSTSGTWNTTDGVGLLLHISLGAGSSITGTVNTWGNYPYAPTGSVNLISTSSATLYITGVQLEVGETATSFDRRPYGTELALCQRYFCKNSSPDVVAANGDAYDASGKFSAGTLNAITSAAGYTQWISFPVAMRATPTLTFIRTNLTATTNGMWQIHDTTGWESPSTQLIQSATASGFNTAITGSFSAGAFYWYGAWTAAIEL